MKPIRLWAVKGTWGNRPIRIISAFPSRAEARDEAHDFGRDRTATFRVVSGTFREDPPRHRRTK